MAVTLVVPPKTETIVSNGIDTLNASLAVIIQKATAGVETGVNFLSEQIPDVIHQLLIWKLAANLFWFVICVVFATILFIFAYKLFKSGCKQSKYDSHGYYFGSCILGCLGTLPTIAGLICFTEALKIWLAPKIYLIEYAAHLLKGN